MKSIMHNKKDKTCYLCLMLHGDISPKQTQEHHCIFGTAGRAVSERLGLKVYLCLAHHTAGPEAVHNNAHNALILKMRAQEAYERTHSRDEWMAAVGRNYLDSKNGR
ncbi:MAG: hypothetical protein ACI4EV_06975 [Lachnospiraceae bacterium]